MTYRTYPILDILDASFGQLPEAQGEVDQLAGVFQTFDETLRNPRETDLGANQCPTQASTGHILTTTIDCVQNGGLKIV